MLKRLHEARQNDKGFTLIELLLVIVILAILSGVVVLAVNGINDRGQTSACKADSKTVQVAQEAHYAKTGGYAASTNALVTAGFLKEPSTLHTTGSTGAVTPVSPPC